MTFIVKVPGVNGLGNTEGCEKAGNAVLESLKEVRSKENGESVDYDSLDFEEIHLDNSKLDEANELIYKNAFDTFEGKAKTIFIGGDHSVSYSLTRAFFDYCQNSDSGKEPCLIVFDAHPDLMPAMKEPTHEEWLRKLVDDGFPVENILLVGIRNSWKDETNFIKEKKIRTISINQIRENLEETTEIIMEFASGKELYVSLDIDVVDPSSAPATGYKEPGGLTAREILYIVQRMNKMKNLKAVDIVEINPVKDEKHDFITVKLGAKILAELL